MIVRTIRTYDIQQTGDEMDRLELITLLNHLSKFCENECGVTVESAGPDLLTVTIETVESP